MSEYLRQVTKQKSFENFVIKDFGLYDTSVFLFLRSIYAVFVFTLENINSRGKTGDQHPLNPHLGTPLEMIAGHVKDRIRVRPNVDKK